MWAHHELHCEVRVGRCGWLIMSRIVRFVRLDRPPAGPHLNSRLLHKHPLRTATMGGTKLASSSVTGVFQTAIRLAALATCSAAPNIILILADDVGRSDVSFDTRPGIMPTHQIAALCNRNVHSPPQQPATSLFFRPPARRRPARPPARPSARPRLAQCPAAVQASFAIGLQRTRL